MRLLFERTKSFLRALQHTLSQVPLVGFSFCFYCGRSVGVNKEEERRRLLDSNQHHHTSTQFKTKTHNLYCNKIRLYFWGLVADSFWDPSLFLPLQPPNLDELIRNKTRHSYIWCNGTLTLAQSLITIKTPCQSLFLAFSSHFRPDWESVLLSSGSLIMWDINHLIPLWYQSWHPNQSLDEGPSFSVVWLKQVLNFCKVFLNALPLLIFTIILSGGFNYLNGYRPVNCKSFLGNERLSQRQMVNERPKSQKLQFSIMLLYYSTCDTFSKYGLVKCLYFKSKLKLMMYYMELAKISLQKILQKTEKIYMSNNCMIRIIRKILPFYF